MATEHRKGIFVNQLTQTDSSQAIPATTELESFGPKENVYSRYFKRLFDILFAVSGLVVCGIPMLIVALLVRLTSPGPALFCQLRAGRKGKMFVLFKFRSMYIEAPEKANKDFTPEARTQYITRIGKFLRKTSIDELPQMINVLKGEMSFIGPRPLARTDEIVLKLRAESGADRVRPGISGLAQVNGRNEISDEVKAKWDADYAQNCTLIEDLKIVVRTLSEVVKQCGINKSDTRKH
ncbi:exopolysaccharide phosphogalactosyltransferase [Lacticaseibacillus paracasei subsp. paracasei Lpp125]|uniref:sugar transferase n=1 Tax=Lacticaseibacillus paracasei TaxID=1597 RepID=UPI000343B4EE|nr:sugar transferase [Lacticaseibacillus paracasei]EPC99663.1 exopolysaccharide phosphogalactosyltransferase [Lacticaseibacillus paracasei subsp. paracasei Lpp125]